MLQVFHSLHALAQSGLELRQRLARQRGTGLGCITLPGSCSCGIEGLCSQQGLSLLGPFHGNFFLIGGTTDFVKALAHGTGSTLVALAQFLVNVLELLDRGLSRQPVANARGAITRRLGGESTTRQCIQRMLLSILGRGRVHFRCIRHGAARRNRCHVRVRKCLAASAVNAATGQCQPT